MPHSLKIRGAWLAATALLAGAVGGCASSSVSSQELALGSASIEAAQGAGAGEPGLPDLAQARDKLARAEAAARAGDKVKAARLAEEADVDAQVARTKATSEKSRKAAAELDAGIAALREEMRRSPQ